LREETSRLDALDLDLELRTGPHHLTACRRLELAGFQRLGILVAHARERDATRLAIDPLDDDVDVLALLDALVRVLEVAAELADV